VAEAETLEKATRDQHDAHLATLAAARAELERTSDSRKYGELVDLIAIKERQVAQLGPVAFAAFERASGERQVLAFTERSAAQLRGEAHKLCMRLHDIGVHLERLTGDTSGLDGVEVLGQRIDPVVNPPVLEYDVELAPGALEWVRGHLRWLAEVGRRNPKPGEPQNVDN